jgi:histidinol-phosphate aminotransferase
MAILRTLSKIGFASLRVGYLLGDEGLIGEVNKVRLPFNLNALSQAVAREALREKKMIDACIKKVSSERDRLFGELAALKGVTPSPSEANFILFRIKGADEIHKKLIKQGVLVRNLSSVIKDSLRVTIGTPEENSIFIETLKKLLGQEEK